jgi:hypothetical protein
VPPELAQLAANPEQLEDQGLAPIPFMPLMVSESLWTEWRDVVKLHQIGHEKLGRVAPSLRRLPTVIWHTPLSQYVGQSITQIRQLRTHGEKRVRCVLEVFYHVYERLSNVPQGSDVSRILTPPLLVSVQDWVGNHLKNGRVPTESDVKKNFALPLLSQIRIDSGDTVYHLAEQRLGTNGEPQTVREQARKLGVTRARVYQLLDDCSKVMQVRWTDGKRLLDVLTNQFAAHAPDSDNLALFYAIRELCYPEKIRSSVPHSKSDLSEELPISEMTSSQ